MHKFLDDNDLLVQNESLCSDTKSQFIESVKSVKVNEFNLDIDLKNKSSVKKKSNSKLFQNEFDRVKQEV